MRPSNVTVMAGALLLAIRLPCAAAATVSPQTFSALTQAEKLLEQKAYTRATQTLEKRLNKTRKPLERALLLRALGSAHALQGDYPQAVQFLEKALASGGLDETQQSPIRLHLGQLYAAMEQPAKAAAWLDQWLKASPQIQPDDHLLLAQVHTRLKHYREALKHLNQAIAQTPHPAGEWLQLRLGINHQLKNYAAAIEDIKALIRLHPDEPRYWDQMAGLYQLAKRPLNAAAVKELTRLLGFLTKEPQVIHLVQMLRAARVPYLAALRLQEALDNGQVRKNYKQLDLLAATWIEAREWNRAILALKQAAKLNPSGRTWLRLAQLYIEQEDWPQAIGALRKALAKGGLRSPGQAWLLLGHAHLEQKALPLARSAFANALRDNDTRQSAEQWLTYLDHLQASP